jgi:hypothetical protein
LPHFDLQSFFGVNHACDLAKEQEQIAETRALEVQRGQFFRLIVDVGTTVAAIADRDATIGLTVAQTNELREKAALATSAASLDAELAKVTAYDASVSRQVQNYDVWRAGAMLEAARRQAVAARRAIEAYYVVDLSRLDADEAFVAAPSSWANDVYKYDLSAPAAVGLVSSVGTTTGVYPNAVTDYVGNLKQFVKGFAYTRPTAVAHGDSEVMSLPGPSGMVAAGGVPGATLDAGAFQWSFQCTDGSWHSRSAASVNTVCAVTGAPRPLAAKLLFSLDPWGRPDGSLVRPTYDARYNVRWGRLAVNLVGTGVLNCGQAGDPLTCYSQPFVRYDLKSSGPAWVTDFSSGWRAISTPFLHVEGAKALAAEEWLDPVKNSWNQPFVASAARTELEERPTGGEYFVEFQIGPEVDLDRIERVQILLESSYWVRQQ